MRIISGKFRGRRFYPSANNWPTRPTTDISKEGLFNILNNYIHFDKVSMLDLFGGTGNHCYEFISRGCTNTTYVDKYKPAVQFVRKIAKELEIETYIRIHLTDVLSFIKKNNQTYDYIFAGPPYKLPLIDKLPNLILDNNMLSNRGFLVIEHNFHHNFSEHTQLFETRKYGNTIFSFFRNE